MSMLETQQSHSKADKLSSLSPICPNLSHFLPNLTTTTKKDTSPVHPKKKNETNLSNLVKNPVPKNLCVLETEISSIC